jgi:hypothetical protein
MIKKLKSEVIIPKVGRPQKYKTENERKEAFRNQNRINQIECRKRKRLKMLEQKVSGIFNNQIQTNKNNIYRVKNNNFNSYYRETLMNFFNEFEFDTLFTATLNPSNEMKNDIKNYNNHINHQTQFHEHVFEGNNLQKICMESFIKKTTKYISKLSEKKLFERCFGVFELGKNNRIHVHIVFKKPELIRNFNKRLKSHWKLGISHTTKIKKEKDTKIGYCLKELKALSTKKRNMLMIDSWFFEGNFKRVIADKGEI